MTHASAQVDGLLDLLVEAVVREIEAESKNENSRAELLAGTARGVGTRDDENISR